MLAVARQAIDHIVNSASKEFAMSAGMIKVPIVFRGLNGAVAEVNARNSQCYESSYFDQISDYSALVENAKHDAKCSILANCLKLEELHNVRKVYEVDECINLIEFKSVEDAEEVKRHAIHDDGYLPVTSNIIIGNLKREKRKRNNPVDQKTFESFSDLFDANKVPILTYKLKFFTLTQLESLLCTGIFKEYELLPFGSSFLHFANDSRDLDLTFSRKLSIYQNKNPQKKFQLTFLNKKQTHKSEKMTRDTILWFSRMLKEYVPIVDPSTVVPLPHARVPIIKFKSLITSLDCDLSFDFAFNQRNRDLFRSQYSGYTMSQMLYAICRWNKIFTLSTIYFRRYARMAKLVKSQGGFNNFQFLTLVIFYLQQAEISSFTGADRIRSLMPFKTLLPPLKHILKNKFSIQDPVIDLNPEEINYLMPQIVAGFFRFYLNFDFRSSAINIRHARIESKPDNSFPIYVINPFDTSLNVCPNINHSHLELFIREIHNAAFVKNPIDLLVRPAQQVQSTLDKWLEFEN